MKLNPKLNGMALVLCGHERVVRHEIRGTNKEFVYSIHLCVPSHGT